MLVAKNLRPLRYWSRFGSAPVLGLAHRRSATTCAVKAGCIAAGLTTRRFMVYPGHLVQSQAHVKHG